MNKDLDGLFEKLNKYSKRQVLPMHMPGHKRKEKYSIIPGLYSLDITEIHGFDNLNEPSDILKEYKEEASKIFKSEQSYYLVNGSTSGILSAIRSCTNYGDKIIISRNSHKSVYHGIELNGLESVYLYPTVDEKYYINNSISLVDIRKTIELHKDAKLLVITSPTYDGIISDIQGICLIAHEYNIPVMVDEAHGSHLGFHKELYKNSNELGADIVIHSLHKTLPAMTQCAMVHRNGTLVNEKVLERELTIFQTSSPSYILMASIEQCIAQLAMEKDVLFHEYVTNLKEFSSRLIELKYIKVYGKGLEEGISYTDVFGYDKGKILISTIDTNLTGGMLMSILRDTYEIELEMSTSNYALAMTSISDTKEDFLRLADALLDIDYTLDSINKLDKGSLCNHKIYFMGTKVTAYCSIAKARRYDTDITEYSDLEGKVSAEYIWAYPPGVPLVVPGEYITTELLTYCKYLREEGVSLHSNIGLFPIKLHTLTLYSKKQ